MRRFLNIATLLGSFSTIICCFLPFLFVTLGAGAVFAGLVSSVPQLIWISEHKVGLFIISGALLSLSFYLQFRSRYQACPTDPKLAAACTDARMASRWVLVISGVLYSVGFVFAFVLPALMSGA